MNNPLQVTFHDIRHDKDIETLINEKFEKITNEGFDVTKCHIVIEKLSKHHVINALRVRLDVKVSHFEDIIVTEECGEDLKAIKSTILKVFKHGLILMHKQKDCRLDHKRTPQALDAYNHVDS